MAIDAGRLRHRVSLQRNDFTQDPVTGAIKDGWTEYAKAWASVEPLSARDLIAAQGVQSKVTARMVIRYRADIDPAHRIVHRGTVYRVEGILPDKDSGLEYLTILVSTGVSINGS